MKLEKVLKGTSIFSDISEEIAIILTDEGIGILVPVEELKRFIREYDVKQDKTFLKGRFN